MKAGLAFSFLHHFFFKQTYANYIFIHFVTMFMETQFYVLHKEALNLITEQYVYFCYQI